MSVELLANALAQEGENYASALKWLEAAAACYPEFAREHARVAMVGDELAGALSITTDTIRIGEARLKMGGLGRCAVAPRHRGRGVHAMLVSDAMAYLRQRKYHVAALFGQPDAYQRHGFCPALAEYFVEVDTAEALTFAAPTRARAACPGDIAAIQRMHQANDAQVACSLLRVRPHYASQWERAPQFEATLNEEGRVIGYWRAANAGDHLSVKEAGVAEYASSGLIVGACARIAADASLARIRFRTPPSHPLSRFLAQFPSRHVTQYDHGSSGLMAFVDVGETLEVMAPEWESLLTRSAARDLRAELTFCLDQGSYRLRARRGVVDVAAASGANKVALTDRELLQTLTGYRAIEDLFESRPACIHPDARLLGATLFPKRCPYIWPFDRV